MRQWVGALSIAALASGVGVAVNVATSHTASTWAWFLVAGLTVLSGGATYWTQRAAQLEHHLHEIGKKPGTVSPDSLAHVDSYKVKLGIAEMPPDVTGFYGRPHELKIVLSLLQAATGPNVILVTGVPGVGKTALAIRAGHEATRQGFFPGGVLYINMQGYDRTRRVSPTRALGRFLRALGISGEQIPPTVEERAGLCRVLLREWAIKGRRLLIILDNVSSTQQVLPLLPSDHSITQERIKVIVTSRHALGGINGARVIELDLLDNSSAQQVILEDLYAAFPTDPRLNDHAGLQELTQLCECLPLALKVVSAILVSEPELPLVAVISALADDDTRLDSLELFDQGPAVRSAFDLSYRALTDVEQRTFALLSLVPGQIVTSDAAAALTGAPTDEVRRVLRGLRRAHLLQAAVQYDTWRLHDLTRIFSAEVLMRDFRDEKPAAVDRMLTEYIKRSCLASRQLNPRIGIDTRDSAPFPTRDDAIRWFEIEKDNLVASVRITVEQERYQDACDLVEALTAYFDLRKMWEEWLDSHRIALEAARNIKSRPLEAKILNHMGIAHVGLLQYTLALDNYRAALNIRHELLDWAGEGRTRSNMGRVYLAQRLVNRAFGEYEHALSSLRRARDQFGESQVLRNMGEAYLADRKYEAARNVLTEALVLARTMNDGYSEAAILYLIGEAFTHDGRFTEAIGYYEQSLEIRRGIGDKHGTGRTLTDLGSAYAASGQLGRAIELHKEAADLLRNVEDYSGLAHALTNLGVAYAEDGNTNHAVIILDDALSQRRRAGDIFGEAVTLVQLGEARRNVGDLKGASTAWSRARSIFSDLRAEHELNDLLNRISSLS